MALCPGVPWWVGTRKVKQIWILLKQETVSGSGIHWAICKSAPRSRQITTPAWHHSVFYRPDALPATQRTASKHWRQYLVIVLLCLYFVNVWNISRNLRSCCELLQLTATKWCGRWRNTKMPCLTWLTGILQVSSTMAVGHFVFR